jgi:hypothetical protein
MKLLEKKIGPAAVVAGAAVIACVPCCIPLIAPVLAWLGISTLGAAATGWYAGLAGAFAVGLAAFLFIRHRVAARRAASAQCGCQGACQFDFSSSGKRQAPDL